MKAMILAAGVGERMRPLTLTTPKPMLRVAGKPLIQYHVENLVAAGFSELVINVSWLGEQLEDFLGDGSRWHCQITWSREAQALETAGGIIQALPQLGNEPFAVINGDIWTDYPLRLLRSKVLSPEVLAHLVLVENPPQHPLGDFALAADGVVSERVSAQLQGLTYTGLALFQPQFFAGAEPGKLRLRPLLDAAIAARAVSGEYYPGQWSDIGTPQRLAELDATLGLL